MYAEGKRREIQLLLAAGVPQGQIAKLTGVSVRTIRRIGREPAEPALAVAEPAATEPGGQQPRTGPGRPSTVEPYRDTVTAMLEQTPKLKSLEVLPRLRDRGYSGGKSAVYELVKQLRRQVARPTPRFEGVAGGFSQHDFGEVWVHWTGGDRTKVRFFVSRLKYSRYVLVTCVPNQRVETVVRTLTAHFCQWGGLPLMALFDRHWTIAARSDPNTGAVLSWNATLAEVTSRLSVAIEVCWPARPNQTGAVEPLVSEVKNSFFKQRQFVDEDDLAMQLQVWLEEVNERRVNRATERIPGELLREEELGRLRPVRLTAEQLDLRYAVRVGPTGMVTFETNRYSMPAEALGSSATLRLFADRVVIEAERYRAEHPRLSGRNQVSSLAEHRGRLLAAASGKRGCMYLKTQHLLELGRDAERVLTELAHRRSGRWLDDVEHLHELLQACGGDVLREAFRRVTRLPEISVAAVVREVHGQAPLFACSRGEVYSGCKGSG